LTEYTELQIIKHALQHYIARPGASQEDIAQEKQVLERIEYKVNRRKEKYGIPKASKYATLCGHKFEHPGARKKIEITIAQRLIGGDPPSDYKDHGLKEKCSNCPEKKHKTKSQWLPHGANSLDETYRTEDTYCYAKRVDD